MCGIVAYIGQKKAKPIILQGLKHLEYRGYDSAGLYVYHSRGNAHLLKRKGAIKVLEEAIMDNINGYVGLGHTRWATHGQPSEENAHPHISYDGTLVMVHNGTIDNYQQLKETYLADITMQGQTDSEVLVNLIAHFKNKGMDTLSALREALHVANGSYALVLFDESDPENIYVAKEASPLLIGLADHGFSIVSDALATLALTKDYIALEDGDLAVISAENYDIYAGSGQKVTREFFRVEQKSTALEKAGYSYYMEKEIHEQADVIQRLVTHYSKPDAIDESIIKGLRQADRIYIVACGTSWHAGLSGQAILERESQIPVEVHLASEFAYHMPLLSQRPYFIFLSQSGETADLRQVLIKIKNLCYPSLTITNVMTSTLAREADAALPLLAGPEIAVASTKAFTAQLSLLMLLAGELGSNKAVIEENLKTVSLAMADVLRQSYELSPLLETYFKDQVHAFYIGRGQDYAIAREAALKLKEITYIHTEGFAAGELKHGTLALIEQGTPVIAIITEEKTAAIMRSNIEEVQSRGGHLLIIVSEDLAQAGDHIVLPNVLEMYRPLLSILIGQVLSLEVAKMKGLDVDKPRNLAKSVTVE